jgi:succinate dehydrogenase / fumarate reductase cytochrome b subunit
MNRPLSPHLSIWKWRPSMAVSIFHRVSGNGVAVAGLLLFAWWLLAASASDEAYAAFTSVAGSPIGWIVWVGLSWLVFQHLASGIRHLLMDAGWGFAPQRAHATAVAAFVVALLLTGLFWALFFFGPSYR